jgi:hypothetical protein
MLVYFSYLFHLLPLFSVLVIIIVTWLIYLFRYAVIIKYAVSILTGFGALTAVLRKYWNSVAIVMVRCCLDATMPSILFCHILEH